MDPQGVGFLRVAGPGTPDLAQSTASYSTNSGSLTLGFLAGKDLQVNKTITYFLSKGHVAVNSSLRKAQ